MWGKRHSFDLFRMVFEWGWEVVCRDNDAYGNSRIVNVSVIFHA